MKELKLQVIKTETLLPGDMVLITCKRGLEADVERWARLFFDRTVRVGIIRRGEATIKVIRRRRKK